jgi:hypothetical protein
MEKRKQNRSQGPDHHRLGYARKILLGQRRSAYPKRQADRIAEKLEMWGAWTCICLK